MKTRAQRGFSYGATFDWSEIKKQLASAEWQDDEDDSQQIKLVWLGTVFGVTPSGKVYAPFACSNVADDCPVCAGKGSTSPRTGKRARKRAQARTHAFARGTVKRGFAPNCPAYVKRVQRMRDRATRAASTTCHACDGMGSISAARDERWNEALEIEAAKIDAFVHHVDDSVFIAESREKPDSDDCAHENQYVNDRSLFACHDCGEELGR